MDPGSGLPRRTRRAHGHGPRRPPTHPGFSPDD